MSYSRPHLFFGLALMAAGGVLFVQQGCQPNSKQEADKAVVCESCCQSKNESAVNRRQESPPTEKWKSLFDGKTMAGWKAPKFGGEGRVYVEKGSIVMETGSNMTGIVYTGEVLRNNYELSLEGMKLEGSDFFCTTTFPVGDDCCSLVVGGWGGGVVGLSNVNHHDASENSTSSYRSFKKDQWYRVRIRVTDAAIEAWIDDEQVVRQTRKGYKFGVRSEVDLCRPLGVATWLTKGAVRNIRVRELDVKEAADGARRKKGKGEEGERSTKQSMIQGNFAAVFSSPSSFPFSPFPLFPPHTDLPQVVNCLLNS
jgi:hypothetical protein